MRGEPIPTDSLISSRRRWLWLAIGAGLAIVLWVGLLLSLLPAVMIVTSIDAEGNVSPPKVEIVR